MPRLKKLYLQGFKSFAKPTEILLDEGMNVIVGPNGSGKSNIIDAVCFVLGRLSAKSMRASKFSHLIYNGGKENKPAHNAKVSLIFDNSDKLFALETGEVELSRFVKKDGTSVYKINNETKTRQEVLDLLAQGSIDPEGFNIILQTQIDTIIKMRSEEKRQVIEEIAGISIYEDRKFKSLHELEKTDTKLKEITTILKERSAFLNNLEKERKQALKHEYLKKQIEKCKASILHKKIERKEKDLKDLDQDIEEKQKNIIKISNTIADLRKNISQNNEQIKDIEKKIEKETGIEQEKLMSELLELKTELAALEIRKENTKDQIESTNRKEENNFEEKKRLEQEIKDLEEKSKVKISKDEKENFETINREINKVKQELHELDLKKRSYEIKKIEIEKKEFVLEEKLKQKNQLQKSLFDLENEFQGLQLKEINEQEIKEKKTQNQSLLNETKKKVEEIEKDILRLATKKEINKKDVEEILGLEQCPKCKQKINKEYKEKLVREVWENIKIIEKDIKNKQENKVKIEKEIEKIAIILEKFIIKERELLEFYERKKFFDLRKQQIEKQKSEINELENKCADLKEEIERYKRDLPDLERFSRKQADYNTKIEKLKEDLFKIKLKKPIQLYIERDFDTELILKYREIEQCERNVRQAQHDKLELEAKLNDFTKKREEKNKQLKTKEEKQELIDKKFNKMITEKQNFQEKNHHAELRINEQQMQKNLAEQEVNEFKIEKARIDAENSTFKQEFQEFQEIELIKASIEELQNKQEKYGRDFQELGTVNLRALEVYDKVKTEYEEIDAKVKTLEKEKEEILKIINEIDKKKKQSFMQTFNAVNKYFGDNFVSLSNKGVAFLELENKEDPFAGGVNIVLKLAKGKYMDSNSLSGGEKVIIALSLIFAIQKYKPYHFYIFDEIDAALDKRNSEKLSNLIAQDKKSRYIIITHNDVMINNATTIYGASMQEGITKVVSLKV